MELNVLRTMKKKIEAYDKFFSSDERVLIVMGTEGGREGKSQALHSSVLKYPRFMLMPPNHCGRPMNHLVFVYNTLPWFLPVRGKVVVHKSGSELDAETRDFCSTTGTQVVWFARGHEI